MCYCEENEEVNKNISVFYNGTNNSPQTFKTM